MAISNVDRDNHPLCMHYAYRIDPIIILKKVLAGLQ